MPFVTDMIYEEFKSSLFISCDDRFELVKLKYFADLIHELLLSTYPEKQFEQKLEV